MAVQVPSGRELPLLGNGGVARARWLRASARRRSVLQAVTVVIAWVAVVIAWVAEVCSHHSLELVLPPRPRHRPPRGPLIAPVAHTALVICMRHSSLGEAESGATLHWIKETVRLAGLDSLDSVPPAPIPCQDPHVELRPRRVERRRPLSSSEQDDGDRLGTKQPGGGDEG